MGQAECYSKERKFLADLDGGGKLGGQGVPKHVAGAAGAFLSAGFDGGAGLLRLFVGSIGENGNHEQ